MSEVNAVGRIRLFLGLIAAANLLCGVIWTKISYDIAGMWSAGFNIGLALLLCSVAAIRCMTLTRGLGARNDDAKHRADDETEQVSGDAVQSEQAAPAGAAATPPPSRG